jgi:hypothetical protein
MTINCFVIPGRRFAPSLVAQLRIGMHDQTHPVIPGRATWREPE